jgi:transcription elongation factor S-II
MAEAQSLSQDQERACADDAVRQRVIQKFVDVLEDKKLAKSMEKHLFNWTIHTSGKDNIYKSWSNPQFRFRYTSRAMQLVQNLKNTKNPLLLEKIKSKSLPVKTFVGMKATEMWPENWIEIYEKIAQKDMRRTIKLDAGALEGAYMCMKCKSKKTTYRSLQLRSADEPMTNFHFCLNCSHSWKD